uniref:Importin N-terminal domain-containing protein n=2 Tax=Timema TaxID=61471 RepID=A0A7R9PJP2_TIMGE|nr:unnamed protein product [Timema genevievae]
MSKGVISLARLRLATGLVSIVCYVASSFEETAIGNKSPCPESQHCVCPHCFESSVDTDALPSNRLANALVVLSSTAEDGKIEVRISVGVVLSLQALSAYLFTLMGTHGFGGGVSKGRESMDMNAAGTLVLETLHQASSQDTEVLKPAEQRLKQWETEPGFYSILLNIFSNHSIDINVRWLAVLYFKNGIDRYWRKSAPNAISEEEKCSLRQGLASSFTEPVSQVATQIAVLISKVARLDCPREWPELVPCLLTAVKSDSALVQHRALLVLHHVVKTLSSKRLAGDRRLFQELTAGVFAFVLNLWNTHYESFLAQVPAEPNSDNLEKALLTLRIVPVEGSSSMLASLEKALLTLRILRKLTVHGFKKPHDSQDVRMFLSMVFDRAKTMLECRKSLRSVDHTVAAALCEKFAIHLTKILLDTLEHHPFSYVDFIQPSLEFAVVYVFTPAGDSLLFERFTVQCLNLIKAILLCAEYKPAKVVEETKEPETLRAHQIKMGFFTANTLTEMCKKLVTHYFLLTTDDLKQWDSDPEGFAIDEGGESWKYSLRPCTENIFLTLFHEFRVVLSPVLLEMIQNNHNLVAPDNLSAILKKDAVYNAVGLAAFDFYDEVNFDQWFSTTLGEELRIKEGNYRVIRRRVAWLIGQWTGVKLSQELRPALYSSMLPLLEQGEDIAVRLTASSTLKLAVDDFEFNTDQFLPFLEPCFSLLFALLQEAQECDTKAIGVLNKDFYQFLIPVIALSTDMAQDAHVYLLEDGLELWLAVLENSTQMTPELLQLFNNMQPLFQHHADNLRTCLYITQANILLSPEQFLKMYGEIVVASANEMLADMRSEGIVMTMRLIETCLRSAPGIAQEIVKPILPRVFEAVYRGSEYPMVMSMYLSVMSRILLSSRDVFSQVVSIIAQLEDSRAEIILDKILDVWLDKMALVTQLERRKLLGIALTSLLTVQSSYVLEKFCGVLLCVTEVLNDVVKLDRDGGMFDLVKVGLDPSGKQVRCRRETGDWSGPKPTSLEQVLASCLQAGALMYSDQLSSSVSEDDLDYETEHDQRRRMLAATDPVHTIVLRDYLQTQLTELQQQLGTSQFEQLVQTVDVETLSQARLYVIM